MKILKKALISLSIILFNTTKAYATTAETYVAETGSGIGKFFLFLVAIGLVALKLKKKEKKKLENKEMMMCTQKYIHHMIIKKLK